MQASLLISDFFTPPMSSVFSLLSQAWAFYGKQPVLNSIILWMFFLPTAALRHPPLFYPASFKGDWETSGKGV